MPNLLTPQHQNGTTRYDVDLTPNDIWRVADELKSDDIKNVSRVLRPDGGVVIKLIGNKAIEISQNSITICPQLSDDDALGYRERIYNVVAKRSLVYLESANDNFALAISSLLKDELRTCASLLYYSMHKFIASRSFELFSDQSNVSELDFDHFTEAKFREQYETLSGNLEELSIDQVQSSRNRLSPYRLMRYIFHQDSGLFELVQPIANKLTNWLINAEYNVEHVDLLDQFIKRRNGGGSEAKVKRAIATAMRKSLQLSKSESPIWVLYAVGLRMYWLRRTADYDYDFDVKTSLSEIIGYAHLLKSIMQRFNKADENEPGKLVSAGEFREDVHDDAKDESLAELCIYHTEYQFPMKNLESSVTHYMTVLQLAPDFDYAKTISALHFCEKVISRDSKFVFGIHFSRYSDLSITIDKEGRWIIWFSNAESDQPLFTEADLILAARTFFTAYKATYQTRHGEDLPGDLVVSYPIATNLIEDTIHISSVNHLKVALDDRITWLNEQFVRQIRGLFKTTVVRRGIKIRVGRIWILFPFHMNLRNSFQCMPFSEIMSNESNHTSVVNIFIRASTHQELSDSIIRKNTSTYRQFLDRYRIPRPLLRYETIVVTAEELDKYINQMNPPELTREISLALNHVAYECIDKLGFFDEASNVLNAARSLNYLHPYIFATMGLWSLRNPETILDEAEEVGRRYYEMAIKELVGDSQEQLLTTRKFYYEMAHFHAYRSMDRDQSMRYIEAARNVQLSEEISPFCLEDLNQIEGFLINQIGIDESAVSDEQHVV